MAVPIKFSGQLPQISQNVQNRNCIQSYLKKVQNRGTVGTKQQQRIGVGECKRKVGFKLKAQQNFMDQLLDEDPNKEQNQKQENQKNEQNFMDSMDSILGEDTEKDQSEDLKSQKKSEPQKPRKLGLMVDKKEAQKAMQFKYVKVNKETLIVVTAVAALTNAFKSGVRPGYILREVASPDGSGRILQIYGGPYGNFINECLFMHKDREIQMAFEIPSDQIYKQIEDRLVKRKPTPPPEAKDAYYNQNIKDKQSSTSNFQEAQQSADENKILSKEERIQARKEYLSESGSNRNVPYLLTVSALVVGPPALILIVAYATGYLDRLYTGTMNLG